MRFLLNFTSNYLRTDSWNQNIFWKELMIFQVLLLFFHLYVEWCRFNYWITINIQNDSKIIVSTCFLISVSCSWFFIFSSKTLIGQTSLTNVFKIRPQTKSFAYFFFFCWINCRVKFKMSILKNLAFSVKNYYLRLLLWMQKLVRIIKKYPR